jgi:hypothetical protein
MKWTELNFRGIYRCRNGRFIKITGPAVFERGRSLVEGFTGFEISQNGFIYKKSGPLFWNSLGLHRSNEWDLMEAAPDEPSTTRNQKIQWPIEKKI